MQNRLFFFLLLFLSSASAIAQQRDSVVLKMAANSIYGTLTMPQNGKGAMPVVIIIAGSGPTDRDGNNGIMINNSLRILSDSLAKHGIASLRYDKRGIGASKAAAPDESGLLFTDYVNDVSGWIKMLDKDRRFNKIFVAGHSEGSLIGMLAVKKTPVTGYISIAGAGKPADAIVMDQFRANAQIPKSALDSCEYIFEQLKKNGHVENVPSGFYQMLFRSSVQPYVASWIKYDPAKEIAGLKVPALIIQGAKDLQIDTQQAHLLAAAKPDARLLIIPNMNHIFRQVASDDPAQNIATYYEVDPIRTELIQAMVRFIAGTKSRK